MMGLTSILKFKFNNKILIIKPPILILILNIEILYPTQWIKKLIHANRHKIELKKRVIR